MDFHIPQSSGFPCLFVGETTMSCGKNEGTLFTRVYTLVQLLTTVIDGINRTLIAVIAVIVHIQLLHIYGNKEHHES